MEVKVNYLVEKRYKGQVYRYWQPKSHYIIEGKKVKCPLERKRLEGTAEQAARKAIELNERLKAWQDGLCRVSYSENTMGWLIGQFKKDERYQNMRKSTQQYYNYNFKPFENEMGDVPLTSIGRKLAKDFCNSFPGTTRKASMLASVGRVLFNFGKDEEHVTENPFEKLRISKPDAREDVWTPEEIGVVQQKAVELNMPSIALAMQLGLDTGQRPGDLRALAWGGYTGNAIKLRQSKTKVWIEVPVMPELKKMLDCAARNSPIILICEENKKPYTKETLCHTFRDVCDKAGIDPKLQFRDLRRTAVVRLAEAGCEIAEICAITGHSLASATKILEVYMPRNSKMAANGMAKVGKK